MCRAQKLLMTIDANRAANSKVAMKCNVDTIPMLCCYLTDAIHRSFGKVTGDVDLARLMEDSHTFPQNSGVMFSRRR
jgi:hypothetical protein